MNSGIVFQKPMEDNDDSKKATLSNKNTQVVSASTAGIRAVLVQFSSLYLRTPAKLFRPTRFDYMAPIRIFFGAHLKGKPYSPFSHSNPALLLRAVKTHGWELIPNKVLPPLVANSVMGIVLYTTYLSCLQSYTDGQEGRSIANPRLVDVFRAGFLAGAAQSLVAAPIDAIYARSNASEIIGGKNDNLWIYGLHKLKTSGFLGVFAGYSLSLVKESTSFAIYFTTFEAIKNRGYRITENTMERIDRMKNSLLGRPQGDTVKTKSENILRTTFILLAGASAACSLLAVQYPFSKVQSIHLARLEALDIFNENSWDKKSKFRLYYRSYLDTFHQLVSLHEKSKLSWTRWFYKGFVRNALTTIPATSVGLLVFEILRQKLSDEIEDRFS
ncbi:hypothetical protein PP7435_CHR3-0834 [Komagataella phaffii CBS 7435]|uniref:Uncharacterized protein n=2 Tax=Komagataella phaffii TaxID=460519 RepID=C4R4D9_KOMPG|nr:Hypothetical protein PAS_chr3_0380 [Komagataella phaffii GS115]AOA63153.1 GQ67_03446T0 [Komagataella phaffii]CAH2449820.1 hypothetical protein BQ9382_C3-4375 [Komagataella phaffii CBS 7435]AOA68355.1 GQ68_03416T0 [Komagataella phaffii GS115]CAY70425.1 Hypothetical protein PAS_chr3_0380 [Komagataella phaffii GS115]CCA39787.1 hypothetical protein PP7435_CHR3-0834 [Komagataella phaffii CBS 7435]